MCHLTETYHPSCGDWGPRLNSAPCALGLTISGLRTTGCWNRTCGGVTRIEGPCPRCKNRVIIGMGATGGLSSRRSTATTGSDESRRSSTCGSLSSRTNENTVFTPRHSVSSSVWSVATSVETGSRRGSTATTAALCETEGNVAREEVKKG